METDKLLELSRKLKQGEYDGADIMEAWIAIDELVELQLWRDRAFQAHPNIDIDIEHFS